MTRPSHATEKALFALSGNQCAHPNCSQRLTHRPGPCATTSVVGEVCHIHGRKRGSPRWKPELTDEQIHDSSNLILLCPTHHTIVDNHPETYTADVLRTWKNDRERKYTAEKLGDLARETRLDGPGRFPTSLVDREIEEALHLIRKGRFLQDFDTSTSCLQLGTALTSGEYAGGTATVRSRALAWCARLLTRTEEVNTAKGYLNQARGLGAQEEVAIATALLRSHEGDYPAAFNTLDELNSPMARSASLVVAADQGGPRKAIDWTRSAGIEAADLDPDGKTLLLNWLLECSDWDAAWELFEAITAHDYELAPALNHLTAIAELLRTIPDELRDAVREQVPLFVAGLPVASDTQALRSRRTARQRFRAAASAAEQLGCSTAASVAEQYAFWLELLDPEHHQAAHGELESKLQNPGTHLRLVPLALQFDVSIDLEETDRAIRREIAKCGGSSPAAAAARLALATKRGAPGAVADYIAQHRQDFADYVDETALGALEADVLAEAGRVEQARTRLDQLIESGLSQAEAARLRTRIAKAEGEDTAAAAKQRFEETNLLPDLLGVVGALSAAGASAELRQYAELLFERTHSLEHAEDLGMALTVPQENQRLADFLAANEDLVEQSDLLKLCRCWSLFWSGFLLQANSELGALSGCQDHPNYRALQVELAIGLGDWESLGTYVESEYHARNRRDAPDLVATTQLAIALDLPRGRALAEAAAVKAKDDVEALATLYHLATRAGWEDDPVVAAWLHRAAALSGPDGPVQPMTLKKLVQAAPMWREGQANVSEKLDRGEIPAFIATASSNSSLSDLMLLPAIANASETDPRRWRVVPAYSGKRPQVHCEPGGHAGFDTTALLTLGQLDLLDEGLDAFDTVHLPHSTLKWLFHEEQKASFHQPSRLADARQLRDLLDRRRIASLESTADVDRELATQVGDDLARLIAEAEKPDPAGRQRVVVRPSPVHRVGSLMDEEVDLASHSAVLSGCQSIVDALRDSGLLTDQRLRAATSYLKIKEKPWSDPPVISAPAHLYLDDLALAYFVHLDLLELLHDGGFTALVTPGAASEAAALLAYESISTEVRGILGRIRRTLSSRIADGRVRIGPLRLPERSEDTMRAHPTMDLLNLQERCNVLISDDRYINSFPRIGDDDRSAATVSTLDLLDLLASTGAISRADRLVHRTRLRRHGYLFVPVEKDEILSHLLKATLADGRVVETAELRAVRESVLVARMGNHLQLPDESQWLTDTIGAFVAALKDLWRGEPDVSSAPLRSDWILEQIDLRGWTHRLPPDGASRTMDGVRAKQVVQLVLAPPDASATVSGRYWDWVEERVLKPIQATEPALYSRLAEQFLLTVSRLADKAAENPEPDDD